MYWFQDGSVLESEAEVFANNSTVGLCNVIEPNMSDKTPDGGLITDQSAWNHPKMLPQMIISQLDVHAIMQKQRSGEIPDGSTSMFRYTLPQS